MSKQELIAKLEACAKDYDTESAHGDADRALIEFIGDPEIEEAYYRVPKWYA